MAGLRIAVVVKTNMGGQWIVPQAEALRDRGNEVVVVLPPGSGRLTRTLTDRGFAVLDSPFDFGFRPSIKTVTGLWKLRRLFRAIAPDVINYHLYASALASRIASIGLPSRRVQMVAGPLHLESGLIRSAERLLWRLDNLIICGAEYTSRLYGTVGCPPDRRPVVTCGIDVVSISPYPARTPDEAAPANGAVIESRQEGRSKARADLGIDEDAFLVVMVAYVYAPKRLTHRGRGTKGHDILLAAWSSFSPRHARSHLLLVGGGWTDAGRVHRDELVRRFHVASDPSVTWLDSVPDVRPCYRAADLSVSPSRSEGHGAAAEAGAMAVPSIVSDAGGLPEAVDDKGGWVVPRGDVAALTAALENAYQEFQDGRLAARGDHARQYAVRMFDNRVAAGRVADLIEGTTRTKRTR